MSNLLQGLYTFIWETIKIFLIFRQIPSSSLLHNSKSLTEKLKLKMKN